jgi:hypothetical protein
MPAVPLASLMRIGEDLIGLLDGQEADAVALRSVGVVALRQGPMGGLDL